MKRIILIAGAIIMALSWGAGNTFGEPPSPQPTLKVPAEVKEDLPVEITIDIIKSGDDIPNSTQIITIHMKNEKSDKEINRTLPRRGGNGDHNGPNEHSVVTSTPAQTGVPEHGSMPVELVLPHPDHPDTPVADVPEPGDISGGVVPDMETPVAIPPHMDTPAATVPDIEVPGSGMSNPHISRH